MRKNPKLKKTMSKLKGEKKKESIKKLKVWEALASLSLLKFSIFTPFFQYQYQYQYQNSQKFQYQNQNFRNAYFNINIKINILKLQFSISKSISIWPKFWLFKIFQNFVPCLVYSALLGETDITLHKNQRTTFVVFHQSAVTGFPNPSLNNTAARIFFTRVQISCHEA